jgi:hypothetical protein
MGEAQSSKRSDLMYVYDGTIEPPSINTKLLSVFTATKPQICLSRSAQRQCVLERLQQRLAS